VNTEQLLAELAVQAGLLVTAAGYAPLDTPVPSCPDWTIGAAVGHLAKVHRWAGWILRHGSPEGFSYARPAGPDLVAAYRESVADLLAAFAGVPEGRPLHTLWPAKSGRLFWARRQAHEAAIHRVDIELAVGYGVAEFDSGFAVDGVDELLTGMLARRRMPAGQALTVVVEPLDANASWTVEVAEDGAVAVRREATSAAELAVFGLSTDLYRWVWNRAGDDEVSLRGDARLADWWRSSIRVGARDPSE
jgi:uncharacterized protein (TIGR03083 family)